MTRLRRLVDLVSGLVAHDDSLRRGEFAPRSFNKKPGACAPGLIVAC